MSDISLLVDVCYDDPRLWSSANKKAELADLTRLRFSWIIQRPNGDEDLGCDS